MTLDELKLYTVRVKDGSGCLFQPILNENNYMYILTAKHLFEGIKKDVDGNDLPYTTLDGTEISIMRQVNVNGQWQEEIIPFILTQGQTYFPHREADTAILKINPLPGFDKIISIEIPKKIDTYSLYGFPKQMENNAIGNRDNDYKIRELGLPAQDLQNAQLINDTLNKVQIEGMSGGGILSIQGENIYIIGIQSEMKHADWANGKICFVPMKYFSEIIDYPEYNSLLSPIFKSENDVTRVQLEDLKLVLFNNYKIACEPFYKEREIDKYFIKALWTNNIWIHSQSGKGKTVFLQRNLLVNNISFCYCDLSPVLISCYDEILDEIVNCIENQYDLIRDEDECNKIKQIVKLFGELEGDSFVIVIDELTLLSDELAQNITKAISALVVHYNNRYPDGKLKFIISTLNNPTQSSTFPKISQYFEIFDLNNWDNCLEKLFNKINSHISIDISPFMDKIISNSNESPRILKNIIRKILQLPVINHDNVDQAIFRTKSEIV